MSAPEPNLSWARALVRVIAAAGVGRFFLSPGARSTPIVAALAELFPDRVTAHYDERGMAFAALGWARAAGLPAAALTTSGSAVANLHPAIIEASHGETPLVAITADRPPELRDRGANQTIDQRGIFGGAVRAALCLDCPGDLPDPRATLADVARTVRAALAEPRGPVHINVPFREPLLSPPDLPPADWPVFQAATDAAPAAAAPDTPAAFESPRPERILRAIPPGFFDCPEGVILIGALPPQQQPQAAAACALGRSLGWPVLADPLSGAAGLPGVTPHADFFLRRNDLPAPRRALHFGGPLVSKRLAQWIAACRGADYLQARPSPRRLDPFFQEPAVIRATLADFCAAAQHAAPAAPAASAAPGRAWAGRFAALSETAERVIRDGLAACGCPLTEPGIARAAAAVWQGALFLGNSMPVRDFDAFAIPRPGLGPVLGNRGASGIDGNIATLAGIAAAHNRPVLGLIGDLACLHDLPSLALLRGLPVTLLVVNNDGGGIFRFVPEGLAADIRERFWETPHGLGFEAAARQFSLRYARPADEAELRALLAAPPPGPALIECVTDRAENERLRRALTARILAAPPAPGAA